MNLDAFADNNLALVAVVAGRLPQTILQAFIGQFESLSSNWAFVRFTGDTLDFTIGPSDAAVAAPNSALSQWYHYAVTRSGGNLYSFYVNGSLVGTKTYAAAVPDLSGPLTIGQRGGGLFFLERLRASTWNAWW